MTRVLTILTFMRSFSLHFLALESSCISCFAFDLKTSPFYFVNCMLLAAYCGVKLNASYLSTLAVSGYPLSAAYCITMICQALAGKWNIL